MAGPLALLIAAILCCPGSASADIGETIILRCTHGESLAGFSPSDYSRALKELGADAEEYTNCAQLIRAAQLAAAGGRRGGSGSAPLLPLAASPAEQSSIARAAKVPAAPVRVGDAVIRPGVVHVNIASALSSLPDPLLATLAFLAACLVAVLAGAVRNRVRIRRHD